MGINVQFVIPENTLTPSELEAARLVAEGMSNKEVADAMGVSLNTHKNRLFTVFTKVGVNTRLELALWYLKRFRGIEATYER